MSLSDQLLARFPRLRLFPAGAYVVGGAVRDLLMGREPDDVDVACYDAERAAANLGRKVIRLGNADHLRAYRVLDRDTVYDVTDIERGDVSADLARRDFTINAIAVRLDDGTLLDEHGGRDDLAARRVRMVRAANFHADPLRVVKGVRMAVTLDFDIEPDTVAAMREHAPAVARVAAERVLEELQRIFAAGRFRRAVSLLDETGLSAVLGLDTSTTFLADDVTPAAAFALLVRDPRAYAERWRWSELLTRDVLALQRVVDRHDPIDLYDAGESVARQLPPLLRALGRPDTLPPVDYSLESLLTGEEIAQLAGIAPGPDLGRIKRALVEAQVRGEVRTREEAIAFVSTERR